MAPMRKPLFSRPAWASKPAASPEDPTEAVANSDPKEDLAAPIFSNKHVYEDIVAQERKRREKHAQRVKEREGTKHQVESGTGDAFRVGSLKKRRISANHERAADASKDESDSELDTTGTSNTLLREERKDDASPPARVGKRKGRSQRTEVVNLDTDEDDGARGQESGKPRTRARHPRHPTNREASTDPESEEEDEFLRELKRKAREDARLKKLGVATSDSKLASETKRPVSLEPHTSNTDSIYHEKSQGQSAHSATTTPVPDDPQVKILIETMIPNAKSLVVNRRASQPLDLVKEFWCHRNELNPAIASKVFFTWNGTRLYNSSTLRGILGTLKNCYITKDGSDPSNGMIILEAVTDEIYEHRRQQQSKRQKEAETAATPDIASTVEVTTQSNAAEDSAEGVAVVQKAGTVIKLLCPEVNPVEIRLRPNTSVAKIIAAFRKLREIDPQKQCWLSYDGDRLEDDQTAEEIGFDTDDCVEVYLR